jgi:hypothetical protein
VVTKSQAIKAFLTAKAHADLASLYYLGMEVQVNVAQDGGERVDGDFKGKKWHGYSDGMTTWKPFRIPYKANSEPEYTDSEIKFDLALHVEGIGMTGWDWMKRASRWVAFDFDSITGHSEKHLAKLTPEEIEAVRQAAFNIPWVEVRRSAGGKGLHLYVHLDDVPTANHNEHAALARSILGMMSALTGFDFQSKVDICGGNMWVWHRKMVGSEGLALLKKGEALKDIPPNWKDHVKVITRHRRKNLPQAIGEVGKEDAFEELAGQRPKIPLDEDHKKLIAFLNENKALWWWDQDHWMLVTHTWHLQEAHTALKLKGFYKTDSKGKDSGADHNCYAFPLRRGAWAVRRYTPGVQEHESWEQDGAGWTRCYLNKEPDLAAAARAYGGLEDPQGGFEFRTAESAIQAAQLLGITLHVGANQSKRKAKLKTAKDGRLVVEVEHDEHDPVEEMRGWLIKKGKWTKIYNGTVNAPVEPEVGNYDDLVRHLVTTSNEDYGWMIKSDAVWRTEPLAHVRVALASLGLNPKEINGILGSSIFKCWKVVNKPFQTEYPGDREWNRNAAQLRFTPSQDKDELKYPTWLKILKHCGAGLDDAIKNNPWAKANGIVSGADYLKIWIASLFKEPTEPLPYLFFFGPQNSGKSIFHEAITLLLTKGAKRAEAALISQSGFNEELEGAIICIVEEIDLRKNKIAYNRIKDWVTSLEILIHGKGKTPYHVRNTTHWIQAANDHQSCPIFPGDTRITMCYVGPLDPLDLIPKKALIPLLEKEAPDFLAELLGLEIPPSQDRLNVPALATEDKSAVEQLNQTDLERFLSEKCSPLTGRMLKFSDFYDKFKEWVEPEEVHKWSKIRVGRELPPQYPKGRLYTDNQVYVGNVYWKDETPPGPRLKKLIRKDDHLVESND